MAALGRKTTTLSGSMLSRGIVNTCMQRRPSFMPNMAMRSFAALPDHIKLEMPNLSPTMEKVSTLLFDES